LSRYNHSTSFIGAGQNIESSFSPGLARWTNGYLGSGNAFGSYEIPAHSSLNLTGDFTFEASFRVDSSVTDSSLGSNTILCRRNSADNGYAYIVYRNFTTRKLLFGRSSVPEYNFELAGNTDYHIILPISGTSGDVWINGAKNGTHTGLGSTSASTAVVTVGGIKTGGIVFDGWGGWIHHAIVWDRLLSEGEIETRFREPNGIFVSLTTESVTRAMVAANGGSPPAGDGVMQSDKLALRL
jgi:hypothetical protein